MHSEHRDTQLNVEIPPGQQLLLPALGFNPIKVQPQLENGSGKPPTAGNGDRGGTMFCTLERHP